MEKNTLASETFKTWRKSSYATRAAVIAKAAALMQKNVDQFARVTTIEMGKLIGESRAEVEYSADILDY